MNLEHFVIPESKEFPKDHWDHTKDSGPAYWSKMGELAINKDKDTKRLKTQQICLYLYFHSDFF